MKGVIVQATFGSICHEYLACHLHCSCTAVHSKAAGPKRMLYLKSLADVLIN